jgi:hypothetical protein
MPRNPVNFSLDGAFVLLSYGDPVAPSRRSLDLDCSHPQTNALCILEMGQTPDTFWPWVMFGDGTQYIYPLAPVGAFQNMIERGAIIGCLFNQNMRSGNLGPYCRYNWTKFGPYIRWSSGWNVDLYPLGGRVRLGPRKQYSNMETEVTAWPPVYIPPPP